MAHDGSYRVIRLEPDSKSAENLSRLIWKGRSKSSATKNTAGRRVYQHADVKSGKE
jgi:hypothetical protein